MTRSPRRSVTGIRVRHGRACATGSGGRCNCTPSYEASVFSVRDGKKLRKTFATLPAAKDWRAEATTAIRRGTMRAPSRATLREASEEWLTAAEEGAIRSRSGVPFKPSTLRIYRQALRAHVLPTLGGARLSEIRIVDVQDLADRLLATGADASTVRNAIAPLRVIFRRSVSRGEIAVNPTNGLELPAARGRRERVASPIEAAELIAALPPRDRGLWSTAMYAGLRRGELLALPWEDVDLSGGVIRIERSYDPKEGVFVAPKTKAGRRSVPIASVLRSVLIEHRLATGRSEGLAFGATAERPFTPSNATRHACTAWKNANKLRREAGLEPLEPISLHECRHTFASLMIASGVNAKALASYMGHASVTITYDRYGHLMPGNESEAAALLDAYLERTTSRTTA
jgi:integrase